jgi:superfamily II DNA or RNA helicase
MTRRFPTPIFGVERGPDWVPELVELVRDHEGELTREQLKQRLRERRRKPDGGRYSPSYVGRTLSTFIQMGVLREEDGGIGLWEYTRRFAEGEIDYAETIWRGIKQSWVLRGNYPEGIEGLRDAHHVVKNAETSLSRSEIRERLTEKYGYEYNDGGIRGYPELLTQLGVFEETDSGYTLGPASDTYIGRWRDVDVFHRLERWIHHQGPGVELPSDDVKSDMMKYYMYRESGGWGRHRTLYKTFLEDYVSDTSRESDVSNPEIHVAEEYQKHERKRSRLRTRITEKFDSISGRDLAGLYAETLEEILEAESTAEALEVLSASSPGISRRELRERYDDAREPYTFPDDFSLYDWQDEAIRDWFSDRTGKSERGIAQVVTGAGKTVMALGAIGEWLETHPDGVVTVVVPTKVLMRQWLHEFVEKLNVPPSDVGWAGGGHKDEHGDRRIVVSIVNSAVKDDFLAKSVNGTGTAEHCLVADECHRYTGDVHSRVLKYHHTASLGLSATPLSTIDPREGELTDEDELLLDTLGPLFYTLSYEEGLERGLVSEFTINYIGFELTPAERHTYEQFSKKVSSAVQDIDARFGHRLTELRGSYSRKLQTIRESADSPTPAIGDFFEYTQRRRELIAEAVARQAITLRLLERTVDRGKKAIVFQERIEQLEQMVAPWDLRDDETQTGAYGSGESEQSTLYEEYEAELDDVNRELEELFFEDDYRPVMYHSDHRNLEWNDWSIEWFDDGGFANVMLSVQALKEGVDVPSADVGIIRVSSGNVRQRIQTLGRILRTGHDPTEPSELNVVYARDTVDESIFREVDWEDEIGGSHEYYRWDTGEDVIKGDIVGPSEEFEPEVTVYEEPEVPDTENLERGDPYDGPRRGRRIGVDTDGRPFEDTSEGRRYVTNADVVEAADYVYRTRGGGRIVVNEADHMITVGEDGPVFLGILEAETLEYEEETNEEIPETFDDFLDD